jgi:hypothetical protein
MVAARRWVRVTVGMAFAIVATDHVRRTFTEYVEVRKTPGITRPEACMIVDAEVTGIIESWRAEAPAGAGDADEAAGCRTPGGAQVATQGPVRV